jgi:hypothetical protein
VRSRLALVLLVYLSLDLANPLMPGALRFDPDASVEAVRAHGQRHAPPLPAMPAGGLPLDPERLAPAAAVGLGAAPAPSPLDWLVTIRRSHQASAPPPHPSEDH